MEDKSQMLSHEKLSESEGRETEHASSRSPDQAMEGAIAPPACSADRPITGSLDSSRCRDCLAALAHRLAQPMTALRGGIELGLLGKRSAADYRSLLEQSLQLADQMAQLIVSLRDLGESGGPSGALQCIPLGAAVGEVLAEMEDLALSRDLRLQLYAEGTVKVCANPERLREGLQSLLGWVIKNSAGGEVIGVVVSAAEGKAQLCLSPPRLDLQYFQIKLLEDITNPGLLFSHASKAGSLDWAINRRLLDAMGGRLEILTEGANAGSIRLRLPLDPRAEVENPS